MKIIGKHKSEVHQLPLRKLRRFVWITTPIIITVFFVSLACNILIRNVFIPLCLFGLLFVLVDAVILRSAKKQAASNELNRYKSTYRFEEIEFTENAVLLKSFSYYISSDFSIPYEAVKKICFTKKDIFIYFLHLVWGFSRADMTEIEEEELIAFLKSKLSPENFNPAKVPKREIIGCSEQALIQEKEIINLFPTTLVSHQPSHTDLKAAFGFNHTTGQNTNFKKSSAFAGIIAFCSCTVGIIGIILSYDGLFTLAMCIFVLAVPFFLIFTIPVYSMKKAFKPTAQIAENRMTISDYFINYENVYHSGAIIQNAYNFAAVTNISETRNYFILNLSALVYAVPKNIFCDLNLLRQIFFKELGSKFRCFPDK